MLPQVGKGACCTLEVRAGDLHALGGREGGWPGQHQIRDRIQPNSGSEDAQQPSLLHPMSRPLPRPSPPLLTSSDTRLSMAPSMECSAPGEAEGTVSVWGCSPHLLTVGKGHSVVAHDQENGGLNWGSWSMDIKAEQMGKLRRLAKPPSLLLCTTQGCRWTKEGLLCRH